MQQLSRGIGRRMVVARSNLSRIVVATTGRVDERRLIWRPVNVGKIVANSLDFVVDSTKLVEFTRFIELS